MKHLVLGSSGIIGSHLVRYLTYKGHEVFEYDIVRDEKEDLRTPWNSNLTSLMEKCDFVYFLAYDIGGARYLKDYQNTFQYIHNNVMIMKETFEMLKVLQKPFVFSSSEMSCMTYSAYGSLKAIGEYYTRSLNQPVVKFWNIYGIEHDQNKLHVVADFIRMAIKNKKIEMLTDGKEERQMLYADDACECLELLPEIYKKIPPGQEIHIAEFKWHQVIEIAKEVSECFGVPVIPSTDSDLTHQGMKVEPDPFILKYWKPRIDLKQGIQLLSDYYKGTL